MWLGSVLLCDRGPHKREKRSRVLCPFDDFDGEDHPLREACDIGAGEVLVPEPRGLIAVRVDSQGDKQCR